jgi:hypothetical protein
LDVEKARQFITVELSFPRFGKTGSITPITLFGIFGKPFPFYERKSLAKTLKTSNRRNRTRFSKAWKLKLDRVYLSGFFYVQKTT